LYTELSRLCPETSTKLYVHEFGFRIHKSDGKRELCKLIEKDDGGRERERGGERERENEKGGSGGCAVHCATN
jgi:hypothetical protein